MGDSVYLQSVVRHLIERDKTGFEVASDWPDVFIPLGDKVKVIPFTRDRIDILAHYASRKAYDSTQFRDCCINAGIAGLVELKLDWPKPEGPKIDAMREDGKPVVVVGLPRAPMGRTDGFALEVLPDCRVIQKLIDKLGHDVTFVQVGAGKSLFDFRGLEFDFANRTTVKELIDIVAAADAVIGYCSFLLALAESLAKPAIMVWARAGLNSRQFYVRRIAPHKIIEHASTRFIIDDCGEYEVERVLDGFLRPGAGWRILDRKEDMPGRQRAGIVG